MMVYERNKFTTWMNEMKDLPEEERKFLVLSGMKSGELLFQQRGKNVGNSKELASVKRGMTCTTAC